MHIDLQNPPLCVIAGHCPCWNRLLQFTFLEYKHHS